MGDTEHASSYVLRKTFPPNSCSPEDSKSVHVSDVYQLDKMAVMQKLSLVHYPAGGRREFGRPGAPSGLSSTFDPQAHGGA